MIDKRLDDWTTPQSYILDLEKNVDLTKYTNAGDERLTKETYNRDLKLLPQFVRPIMQKVMPEYLENFCVKCSKCDMDYTALVCGTKSNPQVCLSCAVKIWNTEEDDELNKWCDKHLSKLREDDDRFFPIMEPVDTIKHVMLSMIFMITKSKEEVQTFLKKSKEDIGWSVKQISNLLQEDNSEMRTQDSLIKLHQTLSMIPDERWRAFMGSKYMLATYDQFLKSIECGKGSLRNKIRAECGKDKKKALQRQLQTMTPWNAMEYLELGKLMEKAIPVFSKWEDTTALYSILTYRLMPHLAYAYHTRMKLRRGQKFDKLYSLDKFVNEEQHAINATPNPFFTYRQVQIRNWNMYSALGLDMKQGSLLVKNCLKLCSQDQLTSFDISKVFGHKMLRETENFKPKYEIAQHWESHIVPFFDTILETCKTYKNINHCLHMFYPYTEDGILQSILSDCVDSIKVYLKSLLEYEVHRQKNKTMKEPTLEKKWITKYNDYMINFVPLTNDFFDECKCEHPKEFLKWNEEENIPRVFTSSDTDEIELADEIAECATLKERRANETRDLESTEKGGSDSTDPADLGTNILGLPTNTAKSKTPFTSAQPSATPINARQMTFEEAKEYLKFKNLSLISSQQFVEVIRDTRELHTKKTPIMLSTFHILQPKNYRKDLEKDEPVYIPKDPRKAYRPDYDRLGSAHFWGELLGYTPKATTKEMVIEFCDWTLDNLELLIRLPRAEREGLFELHGFIKSTDEFVRTTLAKIYNAEIETINEIRQSVEDHYATLNVNTTQTEKVKKKQTAQTPAIATGRTKPTTHQKLMIDDDMFSVTEILRSNGKLIPDDAEPTKYKVWLDLFVKQIWKDALIDEAKIFDEVKKSKEFLKDEFRQDIRMQWLKEYEEVKGITIPESHSHRPKLNQLYGVYIVRKQNKLFCMDRTGSGKTLMAILSAIDSNSRFCLVVCPVNIAEQWKIEIRKALPHAMITGGSDKHGFDTDTNVNPDYDLKKNIPMRRFHIVNFDKFSRNTKRTRAMIDGLRNKTPDMIIIDEAQNVKINDDYTANADLVQSKRKNDNISTRRKNIEGLVSSQRKKKELQNNDWVNKNLPPKRSKKFESRKKQLEKSAKKKEMKLIFLSATPMINTLSEAKSLIRLLTGEDYTHLKQWNSQKNASLMFMEFQPFSMRSTKSFNVNVHGLNPEEAIETDITPKFTKHPDDMTFLDWEIIATEARLPEIIRAIGNRKTIIYTHYVGNGLVEMIKKACEKAGIKCGYFIGVDPKRGMYKEEAKGGLIDYTKKNPDGSYFNPFTQGDTQVVIASQSLAEGFDGLQGTCNNLILNGIPWTYAEIEQIVGRLDREGQTAKKVDVHMLFAKICGYQYDRKVKWNRVDLKRQYANIVVDGRLEDKEDTLVDIKAKAKVRLGDMIKHIKDMSEKTVGGINDTI